MQTDTTTDSCTNAKCTTNPHMHMADINSYNKYMHIQHIHTCAKAFKRYTKTNTQTKTHTDKQKFSEHQFDDPLTYTQGTQADTNTMANNHNHHVLTTTIN